MLLRRLWEELLHEGKSDVKESPFFVLFHVHAANWLINLFLFKSQKSLIDKLRLLINPAPAVLTGVYAKPLGKVKVVQIEF